MSRLGPGPDPGARPGIRRRWAPRRAPGVAAEVLPLALRNLRTWGVRYALLAGMVAVGLAAYIAFDGYFRGFARTAALVTEPLRLPADVVVRLEGPAPGAAMEELFGGHFVAGVEPAWADRALGPLGDAEVWVIPPDSRLVDRAFVVARGRPPQQKDEVWLPEALADDAGIGLGDPLPLAFVDGSGRVLAQQTYTVVGLFRSASPLFGGPVIVPAGMAGAARPVYFVRATEEARAAEVVAARLEGILAARGVDSTLWTADLGRRRAELRSGEIFDPGRRAVGLAFLIVGLGVFTVLLITFLDRRRELAILKTVGADGGVIGRLHLAEVGLTAGAGVLGGMWLGFAVARLLESATAWPVLSGPASAAWGVVFVAAVITGAVALPVALARAATVQALLTDGRIHLVTQRVRTRRVG